MQVAREGGVIRLQGMMGFGNETGGQARNLSVYDAVCIVLGVVIGSGIFALPSLVAANSPGPWTMMGLWILGGGMSLIGALCYAELACTYPDKGGDYHFLRRAYGSGVGFLFVWGRMAVIQTGALAAAAFIAGNYATELMRLGEHSAAIYAGAIIVALTLLNLLGLKAAKWAQNGLVVVITLGLLAVVVAGFWQALAGGGAATTEVATGGNAGGMIGLALIFVLFSYGGWNEAAYLSAEIRGPRRNIMVTLMWGIGIVTLIYLLVNAAMLAGLGRAGMAASPAVAASLLRGAWGELGAVFISVLVIVAVLSTVNATIITGARSNYALGRDFPRVFGFMGIWNERRGVPAAGLLVQGVIALSLVVLAPLLFEEGGLEVMVAYTAPVFWFFFFLAGLSLIVLRLRDPAAERPFRVPLFPLTPLVFCAVCLYMLRSSVLYAGNGSLVGVGVVAAGLPILLFVRNPKLKGTQ